MSKTIGRFDFEILGGGRPEPGKIPTSPIALLTLKRWATNNGTLLVSPNLMSDGEIDEYVSALKADLNGVATAAKSALKKAR